MKRLILLAFVLSIYSCTCDSNYVYQQPDSINDGLQVAQLHSVGIDSSIITKAVNKISCGKFGEVHSMLIYKNGKLVLDEYFPGHRYQWDKKNYHGEFVNWDKTMVHEQMSCTKSFASVLVGIAIDKGFINNVNQSIFDYLPDHQNFKRDNKAYITIEHLITMSSGLAWDEWGDLHGSSANDIDRIYFDCSDDPIKCVLERELWSAPGEAFNYNGGGLIILGEIVKNASGMPVDEFAETYLFSPLGITKSKWYQFNNGTFATDGSLHVTPRAMLKFGIIYLNNGFYNEEQVISKNWTDKSAIPFNNNNDIKIPGEDSSKNGYGYTWWTTEFTHHGKTINMFRAGGWGGQEIMIFPELDMIVVFTGGNYNRKTKLFKLIEDYVLKAL